MMGLDDRLRNHYQNQQLDHWEVEEILHGSEIAQPVKTPQPRSFLGAVLSPLPIAAIFALLMVGAALLTHQYGSQAERMTRMLHEAAMNHTTRLQLEFTSSNVASINQSMQQLPFDVLLPDEFKHGYEVLGARYCTISGHLAAHLKLIDKTSDKQISLFMTRASDELNHIDRTHKGIDGIDVQLWNESGLFYAKAQLGS